MRVCYGRVLSVFTVLGLLTGFPSVRAESDAEAHKIHHVVIVWLKQAGDEALRRQYIEASKALAELPGVLAYDVGTPAQIKRDHVSTALDESYDLAVSSTFENRHAFEEFLNNPEYLRVAQQVLRPLVDRYKVYDFNE